VGVLKLIREGMNLCLVGEFGIGKSYNLNKLADYFNTSALSSNPGIMELGKLVNQDFKSRKSAFDYLLGLDGKLVLFFDDVHESRKDTVSFILKLCRKHVIVCASERELERLNYDFKTVKLRKMDWDESMKLAENFCKDRKACISICKNSRGLPLLIVRGAEHFKVTGEVRQVFNFNWKKVLFSRLTVLAYLFLSIRYLARFNNNWELYSILSSVAYVLLAFNRISRKL